MRETEQGQLRALTGTRFIAALAVVVYHYVQYFTIPLQFQALQHHDGWLGILEQGNFGVDFFFVLSGFILAYTYLSERNDLRGGRRNFWVARIARVYPVYLLGLALDVVPFLRYSHHPAGLAGSVVTTPVLLQAWIPMLTGQHGWNPPGWSLCAEALFYALFPFLLVLIARLSNRWLGVVATAAWALIGLLPLASVALWQAATGGVPWWWDIALYFEPLLRLPEFMLGLALGVYFLRQSASPRRLSRFAPHSFDLALGAVLACGLGVLILRPEVPHMYAVAPLLAPLFAAAIYLLAWQKGWLNRILSAGLMVWLGEISYGVYILHWPLWSWVAAISNHLAAGSATTLIVLPIYLGLLIALSGASYAVIERPARRAIRARWSGRPAGAGVEQSVEVATVR